MSKDVRASVFYGSISFLPCPLAKWQEWFDLKIAAIPPEYRDKTTVSFANDDDDCVNMDISYVRPETDEDIRRRKAQDALILAEQLASAEHVYLTLKAKVEANANAK